MDIEGDMKNKTNRIDVGEKTKWLGIRMALRVKTGGGCILIIVELLDSHASFVE